MIAGWIALAGVLQAALNFDTRVAASTKQHALYAFFLCDIYWLPLMWLYQDVIHYNHIVGSIFTIFLRLNIRPSRTQRVLCRGRGGGPQKESVDA